MHMRDGNSNVDIYCADGPDATLVRSSQSEQSAKRPGHQAPRPRGGGPKRRKGSDTMPSQKFSPNTDAAHLAQEHEDQPAARRMPLTSLSPTYALDALKPDVWP